MGHGWDESAQGWIEGLGESGDWTRIHVLDGPMLARVDAGPFQHALDVGCGEGRFCRMLRARGIAATGLDPTVSLIEEARKRDPLGDYLIGRAESLPFEDGSVDLAVSYLSLIDISDYRAAIAEMMRILAPGGTLLIANLQSFATTPLPATASGRWIKDDMGAKQHFRIDHYLDDSVSREVWLDGRIDIANHHRPLSAYMQALIGQGLRLTHYEEPRAIDGGLAREADYNRVPYAFLMEWRKL